MKNNYSALLLFLVGLGSQTQIHFIGSIGISELPIFLLAPFIFLTDYKKLKADGFLPFVWLSIATCVGCLVSSYANNTPVVYFLKGLAFPYAIFASTVVIHRLLRNNLNAFKWYFVGAFISGIISIFVFQQETFTQGVAGEEGVEMVVGNVLFWGRKVKEILTLPIKAAYMSMPTPYSACALFVSSLVYILFSSTSGRSAALIGCLSFILILLSGRSRKRMASMGRHIVKLGIFALVLVWIFKVGYSQCAKNGYLGAEAQQKYFTQTRMGDSTLALLMAGRMELFCGVMACLDHPIIGFGPKAEDTGGYTERYLREYGAPEDYESFIWAQQYYGSRGEWYIRIPAHSHIAMFWVFYGLVGLLLWIYVLWLFFCYLRKYAPAIPQYYGYVCIGISATLWDIFFSPFAARIDTPLLICCILFCKSVHERKMQLPYDMEMEARKHA